MCNVLFTKMMDVTLAATSVVADIFTESEFWKMSSCLEKIYWLIIQIDAPGFVTHLEFHAQSNIFIADVKLSPNQYSPL